MALMMMMTVLAANLTWVELRVLNQLEYVLQTYFYNTHSPVYAIILVHT